MFANKTTANEMIVNVEILLLLVDIFESSKRQKTVFFVLFVAGLRHRASYFDILSSFSYKFKF